MAPGGSGTGSGSSSEPETKDPLKSDQLLNLQLASSSLPSFWHGNPKLWFKQAELIMASHRLTSDDSKFNHILKHLNETQSSIVSDIILNPPSANKYKTLKEALIKRSEESEMRRIQTVLQTVEMGNQSPSAFHRQLVHLAGDSSALTEDLIKKLWISRLPSTIGAILIGRETDEISNLYDLADRIWGMNNPFTNPFCNAFDSNRPSTSTQSNFTTQQTKDLNFQISELVRTVNELKSKFNDFEQNQSNSNVHNQNRGRNRSRSRSNRYNRSSSRSSRKYDICWYHYKFGNNAKKCGDIENCKFKAEN